MGCVLTHAILRSCVVMSMGCGFFSRFLSGESITFPFLNKFGSIHSHVQSIGFNVCRSVDGQADLLTGFNKLGGDHFTSKHLSIP